MLVETDAPWLAPVPHRGKQNEPQYVVEVAKAVAKIKDISYEEVSEVTTANFKQLFFG
jgi:TatD DNase family protein